MELSPPELSLFYRRQLIVIKKCVACVFSLIGWLIGFVLLQTIIVISTFKNWVDLLFPGEAALSSDKHAVHFLSLQKQILEETKIKTWKYSDWCSWDHQHVTARCVNRKMFTDKLTCKFSWKNEQISFIWVNLCLVFGLGSVFSRWSRK